MLLNLFGSCSNVCKNGQSSTCQTPAQVTCAHCQRSSESASAPHLFYLFRLPPKRLTEPHIIEWFSLPSTPCCDFFSFQLAEISAEKVLHSGLFRLTHQQLLFCFDLHHLMFVKTLSCGPRIIGKYQNPSTPQRFNLPFVSARFRTFTRAGHCREVSEFVNPLNRVFTFVSARFRCLTRAAHCREISESVNSPVRFSFLRFGSFPIPSLGPRIVGKYRNPSTPLCAFCCFLLRLSFGHRCKGADCAWQQTFWEAVSSS